MVYVEEKIKLSKPDTLGYALNFLMHNICNRLYFIRRGSYRGGQGIHYSPVGDNPRFDELEEGSLVRVKPEDREVDDANPSLIRNKENNYGAA